MLDFLFLENNWIHFIVFDSFLGWKKLITNLFQYFYRMMIIEAVLVIERSKHLLNFLVEDDNKLIKLSFEIFCLICSWDLFLVGHSAVVALLLENGAEYSVSDSNGATPLHYAAQNNHHVS